MTSRKAAKDKATGKIARARSTPTKNAARPSAEGMLEEVKAAGGFERALCALHAVVGVELRGLPEAAPFRHVDAPLDDEQTRAIVQGREAIAVLLHCMANLTERDLTEEQARPFLEHIRSTYAKWHGIDLDSQRQARAELMRLVDEVARAELTEEEAALPSEAIEAALEALLENRTEWVLHSFSEHFPDLARRLREPEKHRQLRATIVIWIQVANGVTNPKPSKWNAVSALGKGVFKATHDAENWRRTFQALVSSGGSDDDQ